MTGIDHERADIAQREHFSFVAGRVSELDAAIRQRTGVEGCVMLSTCSRTELYLHCAEDAFPDPAALLCEVAGQDVDSCRRMFVSKDGEEAIVHLMEVACGLRSQILGEDQIISQVKQAVQIARDAKTAGPVLETLFRCAVTAGKKVRSGDS